LQALARTVYARKDILILDDVFSGIDNNTEQIIFDRLWGSNGIFRRLRTTVVLATHAGMSSLFISWVIVIVGITQMMNSWISGVSIHDA
jgi:ATP-binding cassette subfamily C (CFTR/MRP) protein 1